MALITDVTYKMVMFNSSVKNHFVAQVCVIYNVPTINKV